jgi:hypothetical protein
MIILLAAPEPIASISVQARSSATYVSAVHLDGRKAVVALRSCGASFCEQAPVQVFSPATGERLAAHGCVILGLTQI